MRPRSGIRPSFAENVGTLIEGGRTVKAACSRCQKFRVVDLHKVAEVKGLDFSFWNKRAHCRATPGCDGTVCFLVDGRGYFQPMLD